MDHNRVQHHRKSFMSVLKKKMNSRYWDGYADFGDGRIVYDKDVAKFAKKHLRPLDRLDIRKVTEAVLYSFSILSGSVEEPKGKNWKF